MVDLNMGGLAQVSVAGGSTVLVSADQAENLILQLIGTITANIVVQLPANGGFWIIDNQAAGSFTITVKTTAASSTGALVPQGTKVMVYSDGTNINGLGVQVIYTGTGLTGGPVTQNGTISLAPITSATLLGNSSNTTTAPTPTTLSAMLDASFGNSQGLLLYRGNGSWLALAPGANGQVLQTSGPAASPVWASIAGIPATGVIADLAGTSFSAGDMIYYNGLNMVRLPAGTAGQVLSESASKVPFWKTLGPTGIVPDFMFQNMGIR
jgi:hypothetical protein